MNPVFLEWIIAMTFFLTIHMTIFGSIDIPLCLFLPVFLFNTMIVQIFLYLDLKF